MRRSDGAGAQVVLSGASAAFDARGRPARLPARLAALLALVCGAAACATVGIWHRDVDFPDEADRWRVPLLSPLTTSHLRVQSRLLAPAQEGGSPPRSADTIFILDSGAGLSALPMHVIERLGLPLHERKQVRVQGASGTQVPWRGAHVPRMRMAGLELGDLSFFAGQGDTAVLGNNLLKVHPWEVDLDRGVVVFGSRPWSDAPDVVSLQLHERRRSDYVEVEIDGQPVLLYFDTGAIATSIDSETAGDLALGVRTLRTPRELQTMHRTVTIERAFRAETLKLGTLALDRIDLLPLEKMRHGPMLTRKVVGLLGMDVLSRFHFRVDPEQRLQLRPRGALLDTAETRCGRWRWAPRCPGRPACLSARVPDGSCGNRAQLNIELRAHADYDRPAAFLLGCIDQKGQLHPTFPFVEVIVRRTRAGRTLLFSVGRDIDLPFGRVWARHYCAECSGLAVVDVNPLPGGWPSEAQEATVLGRFYPRYPLRL